MSGIKKIHHTIKSDVFSLAVSIYTLCRLKKPEEKEFIKAADDKQPDEFPELDINIYSQEFQEILLWCLKFEPDERPDFEELCEQLRLVQGQPTQIIAQPLKLINAQPLKLISD